MEKEKKEEGTIIKATENKDVITEEDILKQLEEDKKEEIRLAELNGHKQDKKVDEDTKVPTPDLSSRDSDAKQELETAKKVADVFYRSLVDSNLLEEGLEFKNLDEVNEHLRNKQANAVEDQLKELPIGVQEEIKARLSGVDFDVIKPHIKALDYYSKITDDKLKEDKELAKELVTEFLKRSGDTDEYIKERITLMEDSDSHFLEGSRALKNLKKQELEQKEYKDKIERQKIEKAKADSNSFKDEVSSLFDADNSVFWGIKPTKAEKDKVLLAMFYPEEFKKKYKDMPTFDDIVRQPEVNAQIYLAYIKGMFGKNGNVDFIGNKVKTDYTKEVDSLLNGGKKSGFQRISSEEETQTLGWFDDVSKRLRV